MNRETNDGKFATAPLRGFAARLKVEEGSVVMEWQEQGKLPAPHSEVEAEAKRRLGEREKRLLYTVNLRRGDTHWVVSCLDRPEVRTQGKDVPEALEMMADAWRLMSD